MLNEPPPLSPPIFIHTSLASINPSCQVSRPVLKVNNLFVQLWNVNQRSSSKLLTPRRERKGYLSFQVVTHNLSADVAHPLLPSQRNYWYFEPLGEAVSYIWCCVCKTLPCKKSHSAPGAFTANTSAEPITMFEIPAICDRDFRSSSLSVSTSFSVRADDSPPLMILLTVCISAHLVFTVLEQAAVVGCRAFVRYMNVIGY